VTEENKNKMKALEEIQAYLLQLRTATEYAEQALEECIDENYESSEFYRDLAESTASGVQQPTVKPVKMEHAN